MSNRRIATILVVSLGLLMAQGCGGPPGSDASKVEAKVSGVVKHMGKLVTEGEVTFSSSNIERQVGGSSAKIGPDGSYSLTTFAGTNAVKFSGPFIDKDRTLQYKKRILNVKAGDNPGIDFDLGSETDEGKGPAYPTGKNRARR